MAVFNIDFYSKSLARLVPLTVCLPIDEFPDKPPRENKPFKTLYLLNGLYGEQNAWMHITNIPQLADKYNIAIVMPAGENSFYVDDEVRCAFYGKYVGEEIVAFTRSVFNLSHKREDTILGGLSMGGYGAARNGLKYAENFGAIFAFSSAFIVDQLATADPNQQRGVLPNEFWLHIYGPQNKMLGSDVDPKFLAKNLLDTKAELPRYYIACGTEDYLLMANRDYVNYLNEIGFPHTYEEGPGEHNAEFWRIYIEKALDWYNS